MGKIRESNLLTDQSNQLKFNDVWWDVAGPGQVIDKFGPDGSVIGGTTVDLEAGWQATNFARIHWQLESQHAENQAALKGLVGALAAVTSGEPFDQDKLLAGIQEAARKGAEAGTAGAIDSIQTTVTLKREEQPAVS